MIPHRRIMLACMADNPGADVAAGTMPRIAETIIVGDLGKPITAASLSRMVRLKLRDLGVTGYSIHGLRKNAGNEIAEAGGTEREIMVRLGHKTPQMAAHYTKRANRETSMRSAVEKLERARALKVANP